MSLTAYLRRLESRATLRAGNGSINSTADLITKMGYHPEDSFATNAHGPPPLESVTLSREQAAQP